MNNFEVLIASLAGAPTLHGARCRGRGHLFDSAEPHEDPDTVAQRHLQALGLCYLCPALDRCEAWFLSLDPSERPQGVVAGEIYQPRPTGRPRKAS